ncbi:Cupin 2, conserved barrel domain protein [Alkaliphilus metalliredigens QYMF]|uniref:Cupin 2, conserved barrel domain protein n=1 Tax=Alkaliphilus metalliredigens (strain QYMF) TaxID=293826 RepID=A6TPN0_ALKMQ|nr:cupin domain-containing protein [Alkaliphilus metalliredigens]ABR48148.1 Cupin 2, conserved barrel domain protein [Alkaliphilus metalliredigens QYMF]
MNKTIIKVLLIVILLLGSEINSYEVVSIDKIESIYESNGKKILYDVFPFNPKSGFEYFHIKLIPGAKHVSTPHHNPTEEHIVVTEGTLELTVEDQRFELTAPSALRFKSNKNHTYSNPYDIEMIFQNIVKY